MSPKSGNQPLVYDENLLAQAPEVTQGQRQEGYDADILNPTPPPASRTPAPSQPYRDHPDVESGSSANDKHLAAGGYDQVGQPAKKPFWKTPKGLIVLVVLAVAVIAIVIGVAVGVTVGKSKTNDSGNDGQGTPPASTPTSNVESTRSATTPATTPVGTPISGGGVSGGGGETAGTQTTTASTTGAADGPGGITQAPSPSSRGVTAFLPITQTPNAAGAADTL
ncbi:unnamed protein product [Rhizoctonia solani]|uniref:Uncharacterized protein n=1 Tax=Rhizoctonia solani TaxID=456999 RepID=A0A8H3C504_9AGAM|nr:unnamed protein product [Rhizoctonia solani]